MNKLIRTVCLICMFFMAALNGSAQIKEANKMYENLSYATAIPMYEMGLKRDSLNAEAWTKLGDCYRLTSDFKGAERAYGKACGLEGKASTLLNYAEALMVNQKYSEAKAALSKAKSLDPADPRADLMIAGIDEIPALNAAAAATQLKKVDFCTSAGEFCPFVYNGGLVFTSNRPSLRWIGSRHSWTGKDYYNLFYAKGTEGAFGLVSAFAPEMSTKFHNGPACLDAAGTTLFFTSNNVKDGKRTEDEKGITRLKIFSAKWADGSFSGETSLPFNSDKYSVQHPSVSPDGKTLYFASDMPGGSGGMDIWMSTWDGTAWSAPVNLGPKVNTKAQEAFPYIAANGVLYFASNGWPGLGATDIFFSDMKGGNPMNMGAPVNSSAEDFGIALLPDLLSGYFSSNRDGLGDNDDIYYFKNTCVNATVTVKDEKSGEPLANTELKFLVDGVEKEVVYTDEKGQFTRCLIPTGSYEFRASKDLYLPGKSSVSGSSMLANPDAGNLTINLKRTIVNVTGRVFVADKKTGIADQKVVLKNTNSGETFEAMTDAKGNFKFEDIAREALFEVSVERENCGSANEKLSTVGVRGDKTLAAELQLYCKGAVIKVENIYYDYNNAEIRPDAAAELDKLVNLMTRYPAMTIELGSHTDARGNDGKNQKLSDDRAKNAVKYIVSKGINTKRIKAKGYGEKKILNKCANNVECTDAEHEQNRRTEITILTIE